MRLDRLAMESKIFFIWNKYKAAFQCEISLSMKPKIVKNVCASFEVLYFRPINALLC